MRESDEPVRTQIRSPLVRWPPSYDRCALRTQYDVVAECRRNTAVTGFVDRGAKSIAAGDHFSLDCAGSADGFVSSDGRAGTCTAVSMA